MSIRSIVAGGTLVLALGAFPLEAQQGTPSSPNMPAPAGLPESAGEPVGTSGEAAREEDRPVIRPEIPLLVIVLASLAGVAIAGARRRARHAHR